MPGRRWAIALALLASIGVASAQPGSPDARDFPNRTMRIVVPFPAGGPADIVARIIGQRMSEDWGQPVVVENRPGANTVIGAQAVAKAAPDGYTILMAIDSTLTMNQFLYRTPPYDPLTDFVPITLTAKSMSLMAVAASGPKTVPELIAHAKAAPGKLNYGGGTITTQLMGVLFNKVAGLDIVYVPFKGTPETVQGLLTGSVDLIYAASAIVMPLAQSGQVRLLAKMDSRQHPSLPDLPTAAAAAGLKDFDDLSVWLGLVAPKGTPKPIVDKLQQKVAQILADPAIREKSERTGNYAISSTPDEFAAFIRREAGRWSAVLKEANIRYD
jgi:tripartite-type tricarboxylate transporter receptor subunit TctC